MVDSTIRAQLRALIRLQHIDNSIDTLEQERGNLPQEIRDLEDNIEGLRTRIRNTQEERQSLAINRRRSELSITEAEELIKRYELQQPLVRNNREYDALTKEIETQQTRISDAEADLESSEGLDGVLESRIEQSEQSLSKCEMEVEEKRSQLQEVSAATEHAISQWTNLRVDALAKVDSRYRRAYDRLRKRLRDGRAVVKLERGAAGGFAVPPQRQVEIRQRNRIIACEHTGRIIVDPEMYRDSISDLELSDARSFVDQITDLVEGAHNPGDWTINE